MSTVVEWIVDLDVALVEAPQVAKRVTDWLLSRQIISATLVTEEAYGGSDLFSRGASAAAWDDGPPLIPSSRCGLEIVNKRTVFTSGGNGIDAIVCPSCGTRHDPVNLPWSDAVGAWHLNEAGHLLACPTCHASSSIVHWRFTLPWGFGNLGFGFWNWPLTDRLVAELCSLTGHRCRRVNEHI